MGKVSSKMYAFAVLFLVVASIGLSGCIGEKTDKIGDIISDPDAYKGRTVTIKGEVTKKISIPLIKTAGYRLDDGTGSIWVVTSSGAPKEGSKLKVEGRVGLSFKLGTTNLGTVIRESSRSKVWF